MLIGKLVISIVERGNLSFERVPEKLARRYLVRHYLQAHRLVVGRGCYHAVTGHHQPARIEKRSKEAG